MCIWIICTALWQTYVGVVLRFLLLNRLDHMLRYQLKLPVEAQIGSNQMMND